MYCLSAETPTRLTECPTLLAAIFFWLSSRVKIYGDGRVLVLRDCVHDIAVRLATHSL